MIIINTAIMAMEFHGMPKQFKDGLEAANVILTLGFVVEMVLKHVAMGVVVYWSNFFNCLDGVIVIISIVELLLRQGN